MWELDHKEGWMPKIWCELVLKKTLRVPLETWTSRRSNQSALKEINPNIHWKDWCWSSNTLATWCEELTHWKRPWCLERTGGEADNRAWDDWMASPTRWTWVWASSRRWWKTRKCGVLQSMGSQRVGHDWATELQPISSPQREELSSFFPSFSLSFFPPFNNCLVCQAPCRPCLAFDPIRYKEIIK